MAQSTKIIACETVIKEMLQILPADIEYESIMSGFHLNPDDLRTKLQNTINEVSREADRIILGFGLCSLAITGLKVDRGSLIIPRVDDCIALFLGSQNAYKRQLRQEPGTYFLSKGWIETGINIIEELKEAEKRLGKRCAENIKKVMIKHYVRLAYIDMGYEDQDYYREFSRMAAEKLNLKYQEIKGTTRLLRKMVKGPYDKDFLIIPPGHTIQITDFYGK